MLEIYCCFFQYLLYRFHYKPSQLSGLPVPHNLYSSPCKEWEVKKVEIVKKRGKNADPDRKQRESQSIRSGRTLEGIHFQLIASPD